MNKYIDLIDDKAKYELRQINPHEDNYYLLNGEHIKGIMNVEEHYIDFKSSTLCGNTIFLVFDHYNVKKKEIDFKELLIINEIKN